MHIQDGILSPAVCVGTGLVAAGALALSLKKLNDSPSLRAVPLTGMMAALVFAGQMVNFPIGVLCSGHLLGGVLASVILGPWGGCVAMALVLFVQMALFADGGRLSYGANVLNMGVVGALGGYAIYAAIRRLRPGPIGVLVGGIVAAWISVLAGSSLFCIEFTLSHADALLSKTEGVSFDLGRIVTLMTGFHSLIGVGEALITGLVLSAVLAARPDLIYEPEMPPGVVAKTGTAVWGGLIVALAAAAFLAPFKSDLSDGLEAVAERVGFNTLGEEPKPWWLSDYELPVPGAPQDNEFWKKAAVSFAGLAGTMSVFVMSYLFSLAWKRRMAAAGLVAGVNSAGVDPTGDAHGR